MSNIPILQIKDENGNWVGIPAIRGEDGNANIPVATPSTLGGIKVGAFLEASEDGTLNVVPEYTTDGGETFTETFLLNPGSDWNWETYKSKTYYLSHKVASIVSWNMTNDGDAYNYAVLMVSPDGGVYFDGDPFDDYNGDGNVITVTYVSKGDTHSLYELPPATASQLGGVKVGSGLDIDENGVLFASGGGSGGDSSVDVTNTLVVSYYESGGERDRGTIKKATWSPSAGLLRVALSMSCYTTSDNYGDCWFDISGFGGENLCPIASYQVSSNDEANSLIAKGDMFTHTGWTYLSSGSNNIPCRVSTNSGDNIILMIWFI